MPPDSAAIAPPLKLPTKKQKRAAKGGQARRGVGRPYGGSGGASRKPDGQVVDAVRTKMKTEKLSQVVVGKEARISQAVISQWLASKYNGDNGKVDDMMRGWLKAREAGPVPEASDPSVGGMTGGKRKGVDRGSGSATSGDAPRPKKVSKGSGGSGTVDPAAAGVKANNTRQAAEDRFNEMIDKIKAYKLIHGHCRVPRIFDEDKGLGRWVNNIRSGNTKTDMHGRCGCGTDVTNADAVRFKGVCV